jgi:RNA polymerase nonessential primary-like sigma factor
MQLEHHEVEHLVAEWVAQLSERQRAVIERRYGLNGREPGTLEQLANELGLTRERVRQIQLEALSKLRKKLYRDGLDRDALL